MKKIVLTGFDLDFEDVYKVAYENYGVEISKEAYVRAEKSRKILDDYAEKDFPIYGYNRGVGWNKDKKVYGAYFEEYNRNLINAHCVAIDPESTTPEVRAMMLIRLNTALCGGTGMSVEILEHYKEFINRDIIPVVPRRGSMGQSDITSLSHIGLALIGEGDVDYKGKRTSAADALKNENLPKVKLGPKDGLSIVLSNAQSAALASLMMIELTNLLKISNAVYCLGLEGLKGLVDVLDEKANAMRGFEGQIKAAAECRHYLEGSYLFELEDERQLYDSLSFGDGFTVSGAVYDSAEYISHFLRKQLNSTDDNPCVIVDEERIVLASPNFEPMTWVTGIELLAINLSHLSKVCCQRTITIVNPEFSGLTRFLSPKEGEVIAFGTIQKAFVAMDAEIRSLANPSSMDVLPVAGAMEDHATNAVMVMDKVLKIIDNLRYIIGIEAIHYAQAIDLRKPSKLGKGTQLVYDLIRKDIPFLDADRCLTVDIKKAYNLIKSEELINALNKYCEDNQY